MKINYKEPYWIMYEWEMDSHHENQYVTEFNKQENPIFKEFQNYKNFSITCHFDIKNEYKKDEFSMIYGKPGKNMGLTYNTNNDVVSFEFWTKGSEEDKFNYIPYKKLTVEELENGVILTIVRDNDKFILYKNFKKDNSIKFLGDLIDDYLQTGLFVGCSNPGTPVHEHRYHGEFEINFLNIVKGNHSITEIKEIYDTPTTDLVKLNSYNDIICLYNFDNINNKNIIYDESKNSNFLEMVPKELIAK